MAASPRSAASALAIIAAIAALVVSPLPGFFLGLLAVVVGVFGFVRSVSPRVRGGGISVVAILLGAVAVVVKILQGALGLLF